LFPTTNYLLSGTSTPNYSGVLAWGRITANDATTITAAVSGAATVPLATDKCLIVQVPRLDFASDLAETTAVRSLTNNLNVVKFTNSDNKDDLFTKVIAKAKCSFPFIRTTGVIFPENTSISAVISAKDPWDSSTGFFTNSTYITQKTEGYIYSYSGGSTTVTLLGQGYAIKNGDLVDFYIIVAGVFTRYPSRTVSADPVTQTESNGTQTTTLTIDSSLSAGSIQGGGNMIVLPRVYVKNTGIVSSFPAFINVGAFTSVYRVNSSSVDAVYGPYFTINGRYTPYLPHLTGCLISTQTNTETSPGSGSPVEVHGILSKSIVPDTSISPPDLEILACTTLIQGSQYYQKSTATISYYQFTANRVRDGVQLTGPAMIREGQRISVIPSTGVTAISRQVVGWEFDSSTMAIKLTLGDYIKDVYNTINSTTTSTQKALI